MYRITWSRNLSFFMKGRMTGPMKSATYIPFRKYTEIEAATWIDGARKGYLQNVTSEQMKQCDLCENIYHEVMEGRKLSELPPVCAIQGMWIKEWMLNHDSIRLYDPLSLDQSHDDDDEELLQMADESLVVSNNPVEAKKVKCGLYCCREP